MQPRQVTHADTSQRGVDVDWVRHHAPPLVPGEDDEGYGITSDADGNIYVTGLSQGRSTEWDIATVKYNAAGILQWVARYNGPQNDDDWTYKVAVDRAGNVYVTGLSQGVTVGTASFVTIKYNSAGLEQWVATYAGPRNFSVANTLAVDSHGNVYVTGKSNSWWPDKKSSQSDIATIKYDASGAQLWVARYMGPGHEQGEGVAIEVDSAGNVYVAGNSSGSGTSPDYTTIKYNAIGEEQWVARYDGPGSGTDRAYGLGLDSFGNVYVGGHSQGTGTTDCAVVKYDASGVQQWVARYNGPANANDGINSIAVDDSGNTYATGQVTGFDGRNTCATFKYSTAGAEQWVSLYNKLPNTTAIGWDVVLDQSGEPFVMGFVMGSSASEYTTIHYDASGTEQWVSHYSGAGNLYNMPVGIVMNSTGDVCVTGYSSTDTEGWVNDFATVCYSPSGLEKWAARYDGTGSGDGAIALALDSSGSLLVTGNGETTSAWCDYFTAGYDASGSQEWMATYNGDGVGNDRAAALAVTPAGDAIVTGWSEAFGTSRDYATVMHKSTGSGGWVARYNGPGNGHDEATSLAVDSTGNVCVTGRSTGAGTSGDFATVRYSASGAQQWVARYDGPASGEDAARALVVDRWGNICVTGWSEGSGTGRDYATVKYNPAGVMQWLVRYNGPGNGHDEAAALAVDSAGNLYVTGRSEGPGSSSDYATVKYDSAGAEQWVARYNGPGNGQDAACAAVLDKRGTLSVTGWSEGPGTARDYATVNYNTAGVMQWLARYNGSGNGHDEATALTADSAGNFYVTGASLGSGTSRDFVTIKYNAQGDSQWVACYEGAPNEDDTPHAIAIDPCGNVYVAGTSSSGTLSTATVIKYIQRSVLDAVVEDDMPSRFSLSQNYPNPFNPSTMIRYALPMRSCVILSVFNALGQQVAVLQDGEQVAGYHEVRFDGRYLSSGVYFYRMQVRPLDSAIGRDSKSGAGDFIQTRKLLLLR
jgi:uncharacterized delta-60 repeat protein